MSFRKTLLTGLAALVLSTSCEKDEPIVEEEEVPPNTPGLYENAKTFNSSILENTYYYGNDKAQFEVPLNSSYEVGDIIGSGATEKTPFGMAVKLDYISPDRKTARVSQATLDEIIRNGNFSFQIAYGEEGIYDYSQKNASGLESFKTKNSERDWRIEKYFDNEVLYDEDGNGFTTDDQITLSGYFFLNLSNSFDATIWNGASVEFNADAECEADLTLKAGSAVNFSGEYQIWQKYLNSFTAPVFGWPVVFVPRFSLNAGAQGSVNSSLETSITGGFNANANIYATGIGDWTFHKEFNLTQPEFHPPELSAGASANAYLELDFDLLVYGGPGPSIELETGLEFEADINDNPWWDLDFSTRLNLGFDPGFLGRVGINEFNRTVGEITRDVADAGGPFNGGGGGGNNEPTLDSLVIQPGPSQGKDAFVRKIHWPDGTDSYFGYSDETYLEVCADQGLYDETLIQMGFSLPSNFSKLSSAHIGLHGQGAFSDETAVIKAQKILEPWEESSVTYDTKPEYSSERISTTVGSDGQEWHKINVTDFAQDWIDGEPNYGVFLSTSYNRPSNEGGFKSSDNPDAEHRPKLVIVYETQNE